MENDQKKTEQTSEQQTAEIKKRKQVREHTAVHNNRKHTGRKKKKKKKDTSGNAFMITIISIALVIGIILTILGMNEKKKREAEEFARRYPMKFTDLIETYAEQNGLEPAYIASVILAESSYNPDAESSVGAQGLMQIMPETGTWIAQKLNESYWDGCLYDPEVNIRYGCWYLGFLMRRYDGNKTCSSAAYHSGQGTVDQWLKDPAYSSDGKTLNVIGGKNAEVYVGRVLDYYEVYVGLYEKN